MSDKKYPAREVVLDDGEALLKAMYPPQWMEDIKRGSPGIFEKNNTSVTRISAIGLDEGIAVVKRDVDKLPERVTRAVGLITVGKIKEVGKAALPVNDPPPRIHFCVWEEKTEKNDHHAEVVPYSDVECQKENRKVSTGYSRRLRDSLHNFILTPTGEVEEENPPAV